MDRLVSMYAKSPLTAAELENAAQSNEDARLGDLQRLEEIQKAYTGSIFDLLHWYAGNGLAENLFFAKKQPSGFMMLKQGGWVKFILFIIFILGLLSAISLRGKTVLRIVLTSRELLYDVSPH